MSILSTNERGESLTTASLLTPITSPVFTYSFHIKRNAVSASRCLWMWEDSADTSKFLEFMTRNATTTGYYAWRFEQNASGFTGLIDDVDLYDTWGCNMIVKDGAGSLKHYAPNGTVFENTDNKDMTNGTNGLDQFFLGGKNPSVNEYGHPAYISDIAIWPGVALGPSDHAILRNHFADSLPTLPDYYWPAVDDLVAGRGGINLVEAGAGVSHSIAANDNPILTDYAASSGALRTRGGRLMTRGGKLAVG